MHAHHGLARVRHVLAASEDNKRCARKEKEATPGSSRSKPLPGPSTFLSLERESPQWSCLPFDYPPRRGASVFQGGCPPLNFNSALLKEVVQFHKYRPGMGIVFGEGCSPGQFSFLGGSFCVVPHDRFDPLHFLARVAVSEDFQNADNYCLCIYGCTKRD